MRGLIKFKFILDWVPHNLAFMINDSLMEEKHTNLSLSIKVHCRIAQYENKGSLLGHSNVNPPTVPGTVLTLKDESH